MVRCSMIHEKRAILRFYAGERGGHMMRPMKCGIKAAILLLFLFPSMLTSTAVSGTVTFVFDTSSPRLRFAVERFERIIRGAGDSVRICDLSDERDAAGDIYVFSGTDERDKFPGMFPELRTEQSPRPEGYLLRRMSVNGQKRFAVIAPDDNGAMYGLLDLKMQYFAGGGLSGIIERTVNPRFPFRAIKFNLPWSPYRSGEASSIHLSVCRDLAFWRDFLDMMAENRFNVLSLWNLHPFTFMVRPANFPEACPFTDNELEQWREFWKKLFRMAKDRGIETYIVNWNICVSPEFAAAYGVQEKNDTSSIVRQYTRECVTQVINEYEDLSGLGVTLADWMNDMSPKEREDWIEATFIEGIQKASRPVKFIHRSVLAGSPLQMRRVIDEAGFPDLVCVEVKFNWSHGHSTPRLSITHDYSTGEIDERFWKPQPDNYYIAWMIRNEDFFVLRWGEPDFIREHIRANGKEYVGGYFVGSEGYIPAMDYSHRLDAHKTWNYAFEKQWLFYTLWGRLLYQPDLKDEVLAYEFDLRYGSGLGMKFLRAYALASRMPLRLASFHAATWDFTLYSEGFLAPRESRGFFDGISPFISIDEFINHETLDPTYISIKRFVTMLENGGEIPQNLITPISLAEDCERDAHELEELMTGLKKHITQYAGALECECADLETWAQMNMYLACKLRAGTSLERYRRTGEEHYRRDAIKYLRDGASAWRKISVITDGHYSQMPYVSGEPFSWRYYYDQVLRDIRLAEEARPE